MPKGDFLGEFEQMVMLALVRLRDNAYGASIYEELEKRTKRAVSLGAIYSTLERLESKGYVSSKMGPATAERGGRAKRLYRIEGKGAKALNASKQVMDSLWEGVVHV